MKVKTTVKAGRLAGNYNSTVRGRSAMKWRISCAACHRLSDIALCGGCVAVTVNCDDQRRTILSKDEMIRQPSRES
jgi:hypothetical protein